jgi:hypothetical protein
VRRVDILVVAPEMKVPGVHEPAPLLSHRMELQQVSEHTKNDSTLAAFDKYGD